MTEHGFTRLVNRTINWSRRFIKPHTQPRHSRRIHILFRNPYVMRSWKFFRPMKTTNDTKGFYFFLFFFFIPRSRKLSLQLLWCIFRPFSCYTCTNEEREMLLLKLIESFKLFIIFMLATLIDTNYVKVVQSFVDYRKLLPFSMNVNARNLLFHGSFFILS